MTLSHLDAQGHASMVDISGKLTTERAATATATIRLGAQTLEAVYNNQISKGDVVLTARLAGMMGAKRTADLIPLCHPLLLSHVEVLAERTNDGIAFHCTAKTLHSTGVEMEALCGASIAAITAYDMVKSIDPLATIEAAVVRKTGGKSDLTR